MRIGITGGRGLVGSALVRSLSRRGHTLLSWDRSQGDVTNAPAVGAAMEEFQPESIVHLAAFTAVDRCEAEPDEAFRVNEGGTEAVAMAAEKVGAVCVVLSSDYVFDGLHRKPYTETDSTNPLSVYGQSKLRSEEAAVRLCSKVLVVRTSWLFGPDGPNFVTTILRLAKEQNILNVVNDQSGTPTYVPHLVEALGDMVEQGVQGLYHLGGAGSGTWYDVACAAFSAAGLSKDRIQPVTTEQFPRPAERPAYSVLDCTKIEKTFGIVLPPWQEGMKEYLNP